MPSWWLGPSGPVIPARSRTNVTATPWSATSMTNWSKARLRKVAYRATTGCRPPWANPGRRTQRVLLGDPDVEDPPGEPFREGGQDGGPGHRRGDDDDVLAFGPDRAQLSGEDLRPGRSGWFGRSSARGVQHAHPVM